MYRRQCNNFLKSTVFTFQALKLSGSAKKTTTVGEIVNLMSVDAQKVQDAFSFGNLVFEVPIEVVFCMYFLWQIVGAASLAGLIVIIILLPINAIYLANQVRKLQVGTTF